MNLMLFLEGETRFRIKTDSPENFVDVIRKDIPLRKITRNDDGSISISCFYKDSKHFENKAVESNIEILTKRSFGIRYMLHKYRKRTGLFLGMTAAISILFISQLFVWEISVEGNEKVSSESIVETLKSIGFTEGKIKKSVDIDSLVNMFLINEKRISWIAINFDGTVAHVEVKERKTMDKAVRKQNVNLVSGHDGMILRVDALEGQTLVQKGDVVTKGQMLVSAFVEGRSGEITLRGAKGFVWAQTERKYCVTVPLKYCEKAYTGRQIHDYSIEIFGNTYSLPSPKKSESLYYDMTAEKERLSINKTLFLPVKSVKKTFREYDVVEKRRPEKTAFDYAEKLAMEKLMSDSPECKIADKEVKSEVVEDTLIYTCRFNCVENIAKELEFHLS